MIFKNNYLNGKKKIIKIKPIINDIQEQLS